MIVQLLTLGGWGRARRALPPGKTATNSPQVPDSQGRCRLRLKPRFAEAYKLLDKLSIVEIKAERIGDSARLRNVEVELAALSQARDQSIFDREGLAVLTAELRSVNEALWCIKDELRDCEQVGDFGPRFIELARSVYRNNDHRATLRRRINERLGSQFLEEKSYGDRNGVGPGSAGA